MVVESQTETTASASASAIPVSLSLAVKAPNNGSSMLWKSAKASVKLATLATPVQRLCAGLAGLIERNKCFNSTVKWSTIALRSLERCSDDDCSSVESGTYTLIVEEFLHSENPTSLPGKQPSRCQPAIPESYHIITESSPNHHRIILLIIRHSSFINHSSVIHHQLNHQQCCSSTSISVSSINKLNSNLQMQLEILEIFLNLSGAEWVSVSMPKKNGRSCPCPYHPGPQELNGRLQGCAHLRRTLLRIGIKIKNVKVWRHLAQQLQKVLVPSESIIWWTLRYWAQLQPLIHYLDQSLFQKGPCTSPSHLISGSDQVGEKKWWFFLLILFLILLLLLVFFCSLVLFFGFFTTAATTAATTARLSLLHFQSGCKAPGPRTWQILIRQQDWSSQVVFELRGHWNWIDMWHAATEPHTSRNTWLLEHRWMEWHWQVRSSTSSHGGKCYLLRRDIW